MKIIITENYDKMSKIANKIIEQIISKKPKSTIGFATGTTPLRLYDLMAKSSVDYSKITTFNLDEYIGLSKENEQSYFYFMKSNLFDKIGIKTEQINFANGDIKDYKKECERYSNLLNNHQRDVQILGIGSNGHIAFNEPKTPFNSITHIVKLTKNTIKDNSRLFDNKNDVPKYAITMGLKEIMQSKKIILLANGENKAKAVFDMSYGPISIKVPASILQLHPDCTVIIDKNAGSLIKKA